MGWSGIKRGQVRVRRPGVFRILFSAVWAGMFLACGPGVEEVRSRDPRPDILLISLDTTRADHLSAYGYERKTSPALERLSEEGILFEAAYAPSATTGPSHATLFTSVSPISHGITKNGRELDLGWKTLAEVLGQEGYQTAAVVSSYVLSARFGYDRGFASFDEDFSQAEVPEGVTLWEGDEVEGKFYGRADDTARRALQWLEDRSEPQKPFFLFVHFFDAHDPYVIPEGYQPPFVPGPEESLKRNRVVFMYDATLAYMDQEIGRLLDGLVRMGLDEDTLVVVTGDHGEGLMERGHWHHGVHIYEEGVRVPLIVRLPGRRSAGLRIPTPVSWLDLAPSLLALSGISSQEGFQGESLAEVMTGQGALDPTRSVWLYRRHYEGDEEVEAGQAVGEAWGLRRGRWKLIWAEEENRLELYDLETDPEEKVDLAMERPDQAATLKAELEVWLASQPRSRGGDVLLDAESRRKLKALGYVE